MGPSDRAKNERASVSPCSAGEETERADPEAERARHFLELWERNLSHIALNGLAPADPPPK